MLKETHKAEIEDILSRYPVKRSALLPLLYMAQREQGYVTEAAMQEIAGILRLTPPQVYEPGETTPDKLFTLSIVECLAACGTGPMMQVNDDYYERLTEEKLDRILADLRQTGTCSLKTGPFMWPEPANAVKHEA